MMLLQQKWEELMIFSMECIAVDVGGAGQVQTSEIACKCVQRSSFPQA